MERSGAAAYNVLWSEEAIRKLMCSDTLRDVSLDTNGIIFEDPLLICFLVKLVKTTSCRKIQNLVGRAE